MKSIEPYLLSLFAEIIDDALKEDAGTGDATASALELESVPGIGRLTVKASGVLAGLVILPRVFDLPFLAGRGGGQVTLHASDGQRVDAGTCVAELRTSAATLLLVERTILNFISRLSGIATLTARFVDTVASTGVQICDTRKTVPGLRLAEKYAVDCGGGTNHRMGLYDEVMLKENHLALAGLSIPDAVARVRESAGDLRLTCETETLAEVEAALSCGVDCVMLDDFSLEQVHAAVALREQMGKTAIPLEVSGGVTLENLRRFAECGVERISVGALTHSAPALDMSLKIERP